MSSMSKSGVLYIEGAKYTLEPHIYVVGLKSLNYDHCIEILDSSVNRRHCLLDFTIRPPRLLDLDSKCGTFVEEKRVDVYKYIPLIKSSTIRFGDVEASLHLPNEGDSGYLEGRCHSPGKDTSEIICNSPEPVTGARLKQNLLIKNSLTSTPNIVPSISVQTTSQPEFAVPTEIPRRSIASNTSAKSVDSFYIPETQCLPNKEVANFSNVSINSDVSIEKTVDIDGDQDFFIPETQEVITTKNKVSCFPKISHVEENVKDFFEDCDTVPSSQFRICTQDFNGSNEDTNNSDDILGGDLPCSMVIPLIHHEKVEIVPIPSDLKEEDEEEIEKEMSALQWSKRTGEEEEVTVTPDGILPLDGLETPDIIQNEDDVLRDENLNEDNKNESKNECTDGVATVDTVPKEKISPCNAPDIIKENEVETLNRLSDRQSNIDDDILPTQVFVKPIQEKVEENLPLTNVFVPQPPIIKTAISPFTFKSPLTRPTPRVPSLPSSGISTVSPRRPSVTTEGLPVDNCTTSNDDDLPPTQPFVENSHTSKSKPLCMSSTLVESGMQLSETSFKSVCNKLLDSDDDEIDEIVAPDLVKQMRKSLEKDNNQPQKTSPPEVIKSFKSPTSEQIQVPEKEKTPNQITPTNKFRIPTNVSKKTSKPQPGISIDDFLLTPDFIGIQFSKDEQLQKQAEICWKKQQRKPLFGDENSEDNQLIVDLDESQDSFIDLLPRNKMLEAKDKQALERQNQPKEIEVEPSRVTRRRKTITLIDSPKKSKMSTKTEKKDNKKKTTKSIRNSEKPEDDVELETQKPNPLKSRRASLKTRMANLTKDRQENNKVNETSSKVTQRRKTVTSLDTYANLNEPEKQNDNQKMQVIRPSLENPSVNINDKKCIVKINSSKNEMVASKVENSNIEKDSNVKNGSTYITKRRNAKIKAVEETTSTKTTAEMISSKTRKYSINSESSLNGKAESDSSRSAEKLTKNDSKVETKEKLTKNDSKVDTKEEQKLSTRTSKRGKQTKEPEPTETETKRPRRGRPKIVKKVEDEIIKESSKTSKSKSKKESESTKKRQDAKQSDPQTNEQITKKSESHISKGLPEKEVSVVFENVETSKISKRKNVAEEKSIKRTKSEISLSQTSTDSSHSSRTSIKRRAKEKLKIAMTLCSPEHISVLQNNSGILWIFTSDPKECDVMIVGNACRTYKLLIAIARGIPVVKPEWFQEVLIRKSTDIPYEKYIFEDKSFENRYKFQMKTSLSIARSKVIFAGMFFLMTPGILPQPDETKDIITCAGGTVLTETPKPKADQKVYLVSVQKDKHHWHKYMRENDTITIVSIEGVLTCVMRQSKDISKYALY